MPTTKLNIRHIVFYLFGFSFLFPCQLLAQKPVFDTTGLKTIHITHTDSLLGVNEMDQRYQRLIGAVVIVHEGITMTCDSAHFYSEENMVEAFSNVHIVKTTGSEAVGNYMRYTGNNYTALLQGAVQILDGKNILTTEELDYNVKTKIGQYNNQGTLQNDSTTVSSVQGTYNGFTHQAYFVKDVVVTNPKYHIRSDEMTYNTTTEEVKFLDSSQIITENNTITTKTGSYNAKTGAAVFTSRTTVENEEQQITGDSLTYDDQSGSANAVGNVIVQDFKNNSILYAEKAGYNKVSSQGWAETSVVIVRDQTKNRLFANRVDYDKKSGYSKAFGQVIIQDTAEKSILLANVVEYNDYSKFMMATQHPKLITVQNMDSLFLRGDTIMSVRVCDSAFLKWSLISEDSVKKQKLYSYNLLYVDSSYAKADDSSSAHILIANHHVKMFSDSMQAVCDSLRYSQRDSAFHLYKNPILWNKEHQANADTVHIRTLQNQLKESNLVGNALLVSETGVPQLHNQLSGQFIDAFFTEGEIQRVHVNQNAESLYFAKDELNAFLGLNRTESSYLEVYFVAKEVDRIVWREHPKGGFIPIDQIKDSDKTLSTFKLFTDRRPKNREEIMDTSEVN